MSEARFKIVGQVAKEPFISDKFARMRVKAKAGERESYFELVTFDPELFAGWAEGDAIQVTGDLGRRKVDNVKQLAKSGKEFDVWETQLIVRKVTEPSKVEAAEKPKPTAAHVLGKDNVPF